jgi:hypothetical protein
MQGNKFNNIIRVVSSIFKETQKLKNNIKNSYNKPTDPILHSYEPHPHNNFKTNKRSKSQGNIKPQAISNFMESSYSVFFNYDKDKINYNLSSEMTKNKRSKKKFFEKKNDSNIKSISLILEKENHSRSQKKIISLKSTNILLNQFQKSNKEKIINKNGIVNISKKHFVIS